MTAIYILGGLALLVAGGDLLVRGAIGVAVRLGVSPLIIGLTLVGFGTSTPELVTSVQASLLGSPGIALGNIVGSNIANTLLILGGAAVLAPITVTSPALKRDGATMIAVAAGFAILCAYTDLNRVIGAIFIVLLVAYLTYSLRGERNDDTARRATFDKSEARRDIDGAIPAADQPAWGWAALFVLAGLCLAILGGRLLVEGATALARAYGVSETVIGLTIVAIGTSMPEFVTSLIAAVRRQPEIAFGNVVGSNIYNLLGIGGVTALIAPTIVPDAIVRFDNVVMVLVSVIMFVFAWTGRRIGRREGALLIAGYLVYLRALWPT